MVDKIRNIFIVLVLPINKGNNKITELRTILQRESQNIWMTELNVSLLAQ
jgi:hypothetical protein